MCGIAGILSAASSSEQSAFFRESIKKMSDSIAHRGPDGEGYWQNENNTVVFGHRRLSILDLSDNASQPMHYLDRYVIIFNGEIYNYLELKKELQQQGEQFKTSGDTEVLLVLYHLYKEKMLQKLDGMFAFAIYDKKNNKVFCARDRFGEKPFFYSLQQGKQLVFASEMKAIQQFTNDRTPNNVMLYNYLSFGSLTNHEDQSDTFYQNIKRLTPAHYLSVDLKNFKIETKRYWDIDVNNVNHHIKLKEAKETLHELFYTSVNRRMRSDVNIGSSLSGGLDSSLIVCVIDDLVKKNKAEHSFANTSFKQNTFSARFPGYKKDEGTFMQQVIDRTNVEAHYVFPDNKKLVDDINTVFHFQEEPFGGTSILAQYKVMALAKENNVTVLLDGQGADEILAGYHGYYNIFFRNMEKIGRQRYKAELKAYEQLHRNNQINEKQGKNLEYLVRKWFPGKAHAIKKTVAYIQHKRKKIFNEDFYDAYADKLFTANNSFSDLNEALYRSTMCGDLQTLLRYADRNSMANSREVRLPFLSHELVSFLFTLPADFKIHEGWTKYILRTTFSKILPESIAWRVDKIGYEPPEKQWMKSAAMRDFILNSRRELVKAGILNKKIFSKTTGEEETCNGWAEMMVGKLIEKA
ncbi:MAG: asparagine synthase (glutamine-hydrolyzing) [Bacteroidetes bacterium]|nr:asparagine synthase (glutamine-hydrolyzing) [Bacteroidota bacterium]